MIALTRDSIHLAAPSSYWILKLTARGGESRSCLFQIPLSPLDCIWKTIDTMSNNIYFTTGRLLSYKPCYVVRHNSLIRHFRTLVPVHLLHSHCTRGLQHPTQRDRKSTGQRLPVGFHTWHQ